MKFQPDMNYLVDSFRRIVETPSPVGFYSLLNPVLEKEAARFGYEVTYDRRGTPYIILEGEDNSKSILVGAHSDTVGFVIRRIDPNGMIRVRNVGGINYASCEGETVTIHTRDGLQLMILNFDLTQQHNGCSLPIPPSRDPAQWQTMPIHAEPVDDSGFLNSHLYLESGSHFQERLTQIIEEFSSGDRYSPELSSAALKTLLTMLHRQLSGQLPPKIMQVQSYIQNNFASPITNRELAELVGYHEYYLNRIFLEHTGMSLHSYLLRVRMNRASHLILNTDLELQDIAEQTGFGSYPHFSSYFKQVYSCSPAQYRKRLRNTI